MQDQDLFLSINAHPAKFIKVAMPLSQLHLRLSSPDHLWHTRLRSTAWLCDFTPEHNETRLSCRYLKKPIINNAAHSMRFTWFVQTKQCPMRSIKVLVGASKGCCDFFIIVWPSRGRCHRPRLDRNHIRPSSLRKLNFYFTWFLI